MNSIVSILLTGSEKKTEFAGSNAWLRNDSSGIVFAAKTPGITGRADGVVAILPGQSAPVYGADGTVYTLGTGWVQLVGSDFISNPFINSITSGSVMDIITGAVSNPNLLINPDFVINQRGLTAYTGATYTVDHWRKNYDGTVSIIDNCLTINTNTIIRQPIENAEKLMGLNMVVSIKVNGNLYYKAFKYPVDTASFVFFYNANINISRYISDDNTQWFVIKALTDNIKLEYVKLEIGSTATTFSPPDTATEFAKCQRFYQLRSTGDIPEADLRPTMRSAPTVTQISSGLFAYDAEY